MTSFSILPPSIRYIVLDKLYVEDDQNTSVIEKLLLAKLKAFDYDTTKDWLEHEREHLSSIVIPPLVFNGVQYCEESNWYAFCSEKLEVLKEIKPIYSDFSEAKKYYSEHGPIEGNSEDTIEFNSLMDFVYIGF